MDLSHFADRPSILGHFMIYHKEVNRLQIPYCTVVEPFVFWPFFPNEYLGKRFYRHFLGRELRKSIAQYPQTIFFINYSNYPVVHFSNAVFTSLFYKPSFQEKNPFRDREDSHDGTFKFQISLAIYLGFRKAYLVGHDYTHSQSRSLHFYEKGFGIMEGKKDFNREFIDYAKKLIELTTITLDGGSQVMDAVTYKEFTRTEPRFQENIDIVDRAKLENLATWDGYSIF